MVVQNYINLVEVIVKKLLFVLVLALLLVPHAATAQEHDEAPDATAQRLLDTYVPVRDRIELAERFWGLADIPRTIDASPPTYTVGDRREFVVDNSDTDQQFTITAELVFVTEHSYWWLEDGYSLDPDGLARSAQRFEQEIYPTTRHYFGSEWSPGVDNDPHIYILIAEQLGNSIAGYFSSSSSYPREAVPSSNQAEIFLMSAPNTAFSIGTDYFDKIIAHEFQHMIHWAVDTNEDSWVNEGLSELSTLLNGFNSFGYIPTFMTTAATQLTDWPEDSMGGEHYGAGHAFFTYMLDRFGEAAIIAVVAEEANGMVGVDNALHSIGATDPLTGAPVGADDLFADWIIANYLNDPAAGDGRYVYTLLPDLPTTPPTQSYNTFPVRVEQEAWPQYAANYIRLQGKGRVRFMFDGAPTVGLLPTTAHSGDYMYWGNRFDESDTTLTRTFDLSGVESATLTYWTWYYIEALWDYGYVTVSTDGGTSWDILATPHSTTDNPHDAAYGPGYTGQSNGDASWIHESIDLTPYVGQEVMVRFEYITDDATLQHGFAVDDVAIPEIGYSEDFEAGPSDWESAGWVWHDNVLPQRFVVQVIEVDNDGTTRVSRILGPDDGVSVTQDVTLDGMREVVIVIAGLAPATTQPSVYSYTIEAIQ